MLTTEHEKMIQSAVSKQLAELKTNYENTILQQQAQIKNLTADLLHMQNQIDVERRALSTGHARLSTNEIVLTDEEKREALPLKLAEYSLSDVCKLDALRHGVDPKNDREFATFLQVDERSLEEARERRQRGEAQ